MFALAQLRPSTANFIGQGARMIRLLLILALTVLVTDAIAAPAYTWRAGPGTVESIETRIAPPPGYTRVPAAPGSFAAWLRGFPVKSADAPVRLHDGRLKPDQSIHAAVLDIDTGRRDLQQCADAVMRLRAEYLYARRELTRLAFDFTSGDRTAFTKWARGLRPAVSGNRVRWARRSATGTGRKSFRAWLDSVFTYAGTWSLQCEMRRVARPADLRIGDVFIQGGFPGHAVLVVDLSKNTRTGERRFLLTQSYMPAQDIHVLKNPKGGGVWYSIPAAGAALETPEWTFKASDLHRFRDRPAAR